MTTQEHMGHLEKHPTAIARFGIGAEGAPVRQIVKRLQAHLHETVRFAAKDVGNDAHTAGTVLELLQIQSGPFFFRLQRLWDLCVQELHTCRRYSSDWEGVKASVP